MYNITFQQIEAFLAVVHHRKLSKAADAMYVSQPALSKTLQRFESGLGFQVFVRSNQGLILTSEGEYLYSRLESLYNGINSVIDKAKLIETVAPRYLKLAQHSSFDFSGTFEPAKKIIRQFETCYPDIHLKEYQYEFQDLRHEIEFGDTDIVIAQDFVLSGIPNIAYKRIAEFPKYLVMSANHPMAQKNVVEFEMLEKEVFYRIPVRDEQDSEEFLLVECSNLGFVPKKIEFVKNIQTLIHFIKSNKGVSICGKFNLLDKESDIKYFSLPPHERVHYVVGAWSVNNITPETQLFINMIPGDVLSA